MSAAGSGFRDPWSVTAIATLLPNSHSFTPTSLPCNRYAYDWDNVFWPLNLLLAQETGRSTFRQQSELFLKNWICAGNMANYTQRGRSYNPWSGEVWGLGGARA